MHRKKKQSRFHLRCREVAGVDSIAAGMMHWMLYLSANSHPQHANSEEKSIARYRKYWHTKAIGKPYGMPTDCGLRFDCQNGIARKRERWTAFTTNQE
jgi:hypothetical protein